MSRLEPRTPSRRDHGMSLDTGRQTGNVAPRSEKSADAVTASVPLDVAPNLPHFCHCEHAAPDHPRKAERPCVSLGCACERYEPVALPRCSTCNHLPAFHSPSARQEGWSCKATGCRCHRWQQPRQNDPHPVPDPTRYPEPANAPDHVSCTIRIESRDRKVTVVIPHDAHRQLSIRENEAGAEILLSRPSRPRRVSTADAGGRAG